MFFQGIDSKLSKTIKNIFQNCTLFTRVLIINCIFVTHSIWLFDTDILNIFFLYFMLVQCNIANKKSAFSNC